MTGVVLTNNVAEMTVVVMALLAWQSADLHIHTDSKFILELVNGGLLAMEQDGWPDLPYSNWAVPVSLALLYKHLLFLLQRHNSGLTFSWVKGHSGVEQNKQADKLAKQGVEDPLYKIDVTSLHTPLGWVDDTLVLNHQSLVHLTYCVVWEEIPCPLRGGKFDTFCADWTNWMLVHFSTELDILKHFTTLWCLDVPISLKELLWKLASGSLPLGGHWYGTSDLGRTCRCGAKMSLHHIWVGCPRYILSPLRETLIGFLPTLCPGSYWTLDFDEWPSPFWYPLLSLKALEACLPLTRKQACALHDSQHVREQAIGPYLWFIWKNHMREMADPKFTFIPWRQVGSLEKALGIG